MGADKDLIPRRKLTKAELHEYVNSTNFSESEIKRLHIKFHEKTNGTELMTFEDIDTIREMKANPFSHRIMELFSEDGSGNMDFTKFLSMMNVFCDEAPAEVKLVWAFAMWDFDGDGVIGAADIKQGVDLMTHSGPVANPSVKTLQRVASNAALDPDELDNVVSRVCKEVDPKGDGLNYFDFRRVLAKMPDFIHNFHISF